MDSVSGDAPGESRRRIFDPLTPTIFHEAWWLDIVAPGAWREARVQADGRLVGRFPYVLGRMPAGQALCGMPPITHFLGPAIDDGAGAHGNRALKRDQITRELLQLLPRASGFYQKLSREVTNTLLFQESGYTTGVQFTYEIAPAPQAQIWAGMRDKTRNVIRRAAEKYVVDDEYPPADFLHAYERHLSQRRMRNHYDPAMLSALCTASTKRGCGRVFAARAASGMLAAAICCVWDARSSYYLLSTRDVDSGNGAVALLLWQAIQQSAARNLIFDFDGVGTNGSRLFFTGFGGEVRPRYIVSRYSLAHRLVGRLSNPFRVREQSNFY